MSSPTPLQHVREGWPTADQYLAHVLPLVPRAVASHPGSREFRGALRAIAAKTGILPTRAETQAAMRRLAERGLAPAPARRGA